MYEISVVMKKKYDWFAFRNEMAARIAAKLKVDHQTSYPYKTDYLVRESIELANKLTIELMNLGDKDRILQKLNEDNKLKTSRRRNGNS